MVYVIKRLITLSYEYSEQRKYLQGASLFLDQSSLPAKLRKTVTNWMKKTMHSIYSNLQSLKSTFHATMPVCTKTF